MQPASPQHHHGGASGERSRFLDARSFVVYYGRGRAEELRDFDVAILEPAAWARGSILDLKASRVVTLAYLGLLETQPGESPSEFARRDFILAQAPTHSSARSIIDPTRRIIDPRSEACIRRASILVANAMQMGFDGLFVDTVSDAEKPGLCDADGIPVPGDELALAVASTMAAVRRAWPGAIICQNMGLETICHLTIRNVNGFCWENFNGSLRNAWFWATLEWLRHAGPEKKVLLLGELGEAGEAGPHDIEMAHLGRSLGFPTYLAPCGYSGGVNSRWLDELRR